MNNSLSIIMKIHLYTIGFTKKTAEQFFGLLSRNGVKRLIDVRINNSSQLAGFSKSPDLEYFLRIIGNMDYTYIEDFTPAKDLMTDYQNKRIDWDKYQKIYLDLLKERNVLAKYSIEDFDGACFLCSEDTPDHCHRRLLVEFFKAENNNVEITHLK